MAILTPNERGYNAALIEYKENGKHSLRKMLPIGNKPDKFEQGVLRFWKEVEKKPLLRVYCQVDGWEFDQNTIENLTAKHGFDGVLHKFKCINKEIGLPFWGWHIEY